MFLVQAHLDKADLRIEMSVAALHKQNQKAVRRAADLEVTLGKRFAYTYLISATRSLSTSSKSPDVAVLSRWAAAYNGTLPASWQSIELSTPVQVKWQQVDTDVSSAVSMPCYTLTCCTLVAHCRN